MADVSYWPEIKAKILKFLALILIVTELLVAGNWVYCWPDFTTTDSSALTFPLRIKDKLPVEGRVVNLLMASDHRLFWLTESGKITAFDLVGKKVIWTFELPEKPLIRLFAAGKNIFAVNRENSLFALSESGRPIWPESFGPFGGQLVFFEGKLILNLTDGSLLALREETGQVIWKSSMKQKIAALNVLPNNGLLAVAETGEIYELTSYGYGKLLGSLGAKILPYFYLTDNYIFTGTQEKNLIAWNLEKKKRAWSIKLGGHLVTNPLLFGRNLYVVASNAVIYCLAARTGEINWWQSIPSRSAFDLLISFPYLIVTTVNPPLLAFDLMTGRRTGEFSPEGEFCTSPLIMDGSLIISLYETLTDQSYLLFLEPDIRVTLSSSLPSPQKVGTEIIFVAETVGFEKPRYEFFLQKDNRKEIVQKESARNSWSWLPLSPGDYIIGVRVKDKSKVQESTLSFRIVEKEQKILP